MSKLSSPNPSRFNPFTFNSSRFNPSTFNSIKKRNLSYTHFSYDQKIIDITNKIVDQWKSSVSISDAGEMVFSNCKKNSGSLDVATLNDVILELAKRKKMKKEYIHPRQKYGFKWLDKGAVGSEY